MLKGVVARDDVLAAHRQMLAQVGSHPFNASRIVLQHETESSLLPLVDLTRENLIALSDLETFQDLNQKPALGESRILKNKWLLCRSVAPMTRNQVGVCGLAVDDPEGRLGAQLALHNWNVQLPQGSNFPVSSSDEKVPVGTLIGLMNPTLRCMNSSTGNMSLYCQNPAHFVILGKEHRLLKDIIFKASLPYRSEVPDYSGLEPNQAGVKYHLNKNFVMAIECFSQAINKQIGDLRIAYGNRSASYLAIGAYEKALEDAETGLQLESNHPKLLLRKAKALFWKQQFKACLDFIESNPVDLPDYEFTRKIAKNAFGEANNGIYNMDELRKSPSPYFEHHAEFWPEDLLELRDDCQLFAKTDIEVGKLIATGRALVFYPTSNRDQSRGYELGTMICTLASLRPEFCRDQLKKFSQPLPKFDGSKDDVKDLLQLVRTNTFIVTKSNGLEPLGVGIWPLAATVANTCVDANCHIFYLGSFCFVRTLRKVEAGEQLLVCRFSPTIASFERRAERFSQQGFTCKCRLCCIERNEPEEVKAKFQELSRKYLEVDPASKIGQAGVDEEAVEKLATVELPGAIREAEGLRRPVELNMVAQQMKLMLARVEGRLGRLEESVDLLQQVANDFAKASLFSEEAMCAQWIQQIGSQLGNDETTEKWKKRHELLSVLMGTL